MTVAAVNAFTFDSGMKLAFEQFISGYFNGGTYTINGQPLSFPVAKPLFIRPQLHRPLMVPLIVFLPLPSPDQQFRGINLRRILNYQVQAITNDPEGASQDKISQLLGVLFSECRDVLAQSGVRIQRVGEPIPIPDAAREYGVTQRIIRVLVELVGGAASWQQAGQPIVTSSSMVVAFAGAPFTYQIAATNTPTSYGAANLPAGLTINTATGLISGIPAASGNFTVSATNAFGTGILGVTLIMATQPLYSGLPNSLDLTLSQVITLNVPAGFVLYPGKVGLVCDSYAAGGGPIVQPSFSLGVLGNSTKYVANWQCQNLKAANTLDSTKNFTVADQGETSLIITITGATGMTAMMGRAFVEGQMA